MMSKTCSHCNGDGSVRCNHRHGRGFVDSPTYGELTCNICGGRGQLTCNRCDGEGGFE